MLDHTVVVMLFEGGIGFDPATGGQNKAHSTENMVALVAGRVGGLVPGRHIVTNGVHPAAVLLTALQATGVPVDAVGEIDGTVPALFG